MKPILHFTPSLLQRIRQAIREDLGSGDLTTNLIAPPHYEIEAHLIVREPCVISGLVLLPKIFGNVRVTLLKKEGERAKANEVVAKLKGSARAILSGERVAINFISKLTGIATLTRQFVERVRPYRIELLSTRKTTPLLRDLEKYAVQCGGAEPHRYGLFDQYMVKDNHKALMQAMGYRESRHSAFRIRERRRKNIPLEIEVDSPKELPWALSFRPDMILLDNFSVSALRKSVRIVRELSSRLRVPKPLLEASGGVNLGNVRDIAKTGVERISVGAFTHSARSIDFSLEVTNRDSDLSSRA